MKNHINPIICLPWLCCLCVSMKLLKIILWYCKRCKRILVEGRIMYHVVILSFTRSHYDVLFKRCKQILIEDRIMYHVFELLYLRSHYDVLLIYNIVCIRIQSVLVHPPTNEFPHFKCNYTAMSLTLG